jgi:hypothetical protein
MYYDSAEPFERYFEGPADPNNGVLYRRVNLLALNQTVIPSDDRVLTSATGTSPSTTTGFRSSALGARVLAEFRSDHGLFPFLHRHTLVRPGRRTMTGSTPTP